MTQLILTQANYLQKPITVVVALLTTLMGKSVSFLKSVNKSHRIAKAARADARVLFNMSNRELSDIGISRCDINRVCYAHAADMSLKTNVDVNANLKGSV